MPAALGRRLRSRKRGSVSESRAVTSVPDGIELDRDPAIRRWRPWLRRAFLTLVAGVLVLALAGAFGQRPVRSVSASPAARLEVEAPTAARGGLFFQGRFRIEARQLLRHATLVLGPGWTEELSINTIEPSPIGEASRGGRLALDFGAVAPGKVLVVYLQFQVNPTSVGRRSQHVELTDGERRLARIERTLTIFP